MGNSDSAPVKGPYHETPTVTHFYSKEVFLDTPVLVPNGPIGSRYIFHIIKGTYEGGVDYPDLKGTVHGPGADWALGHVDGSGVTLDVRLICKSPSGADCLVNVVGKSVRDANDPTSSFVSSAAVFETSEEETNYLNNKILIGVGKKLGSKIVVVYYDLVFGGSGKSPSSLNLKMKNIFSTKFMLGGSATLPNGPRGSKIFYQVIKGAFAGGDECPTFFGKVQGGTYSERTLPDGHEGACLDVSVLFQLENGAFIHVTLTGRKSKNEEDPTGKATIRTSAVFEVGDDAKDFKWLNNKIYHGIGTKEGDVLSIDYYEVTAEE